MNAFEKFLLGLISVGAGVAPIFIHSANGTAILNASEELFAAILSKTTAPTVPPATGGTV